MPFKLVLGVNIESKNLKSVEILKNLKMYPFPFIIESFLTRGNEVILSLHAKTLIRQSFTTGNDKLHSTPII